MSDLEDYDPLESESSEGDIKAPAFGGHVESEGCVDNEACKEPSLGAAAEALEGALERAKSCLKESAAVPEGCEAAAELLGGRLSRPNCSEAKRCFHQNQQQQQQQHLLEGKPRIWSLAQTATSLPPGEYPSSCMLKRGQQGAPSVASALASPTAGAVERPPPKDSPVTNLRNWVDGVFHDPLFRHTTLNQALGSPAAASWAAGPKGSLLETPGALGRSLAGGAAAGLKGQMDAGKDFLAFPKAGSKMFCS